MAAKSVYGYVSAGAVIAGASIWLASAPAIAHADTDTAPHDSSPSSSSPAGSSSSTAGGGKGASVRAAGRSGSAAPAAAAGVVSGGANLTGSRVTRRVTVSTRSTRPAGASAPDSTTAPVTASSAPPTPAADPTAPEVDLLAGVLSLLGLTTPQAPSISASAAAVASGGADPTGTPRVTVSTGSADLADRREVADTGAAVSRVTAAAATSTRPAATVAVATPSVATAAIVTAPVATSSIATASVAPANVLTPVVNLLAGVLSFFGLNTPQAPSNPLGALVWEVFRQVETAFGVVPMAAQPTVSTPTSEGVVTGTVGFDQSAGLPLTYTTTADATQGVVSVNPDGTFTYTPTQAARLAAGAPGAAANATFTVTATNGLAATVTTVTVAVSPFEKGTVIASIPVGDSPYGVALSPDGKHAYVTNRNDGTVSVIDTATNTVTDTIAPITAGTYPEGVAVSPDGKHVYVVNSGRTVQGTLDGTVLVIDTATDTIINSRVVGIDPSAVAVTPDGKYAYITNSGDGTVSVLDTATNEILGVLIPVGFRPVGVAVTPDGKYAYITNSGDHTVSVLDTATNTTVGNPIPVAVDGNPHGVAVAVTARGTYAYVANLGDSDHPLGGTVSVIDTASNTTIADIPLTGDGYPEGVAVSPDGRFVYVGYLNPGDGTHVNGTVLVIDTATNALVGAPIALGSLLPTAVAVSPDGSLAYVTTADYPTGDGTVSVIYTGNWVDPEAVA
jgi:YVTN family beta-propeller protein/VCBS repeat-containing protein